MGPAPGELIDVASERRWGEVDALFAALVAQGGGDLDHSAALVELRRRNGVE